MRGSFGTRRLKAEAETNYENANLEYSPKLVKRGRFGLAEWLDPGQAAPGGDGCGAIDITVQAESGTPANANQVQALRRRRLRPDEFENRQRRSLQSGRYGVFWT